MRVRLHMLCSSPNLRRAAPLRVSSPRYAADAPCRFPSPINQPLRVAVTLDCALVNWQVLSRPTPSLTVNRLKRMFRQFFVSLNGSASGRSNGGTKFRPAKAVRIGANDARHREHLMAPARQLTSSATLKSKGCREIRLLEVRRLVARGRLV